jgi:iron complex transport system ATP-binding protein
LIFAGENNKLIFMPRIPASTKRAAPVLEISDLHIERGRTVILENISWRVNACEQWVILGANCSGNTSLHSAITGYLMPTRGGVSALGRRYGETDWRELRKRIGIVSSSVRQMMADSEPALETVVSGKNAVIDLWGKPSRRDRVAALRILKQIECAQLAERPWMVLSQGERQRVLIGRALMARPRLLILDEPCAGLDPAAREHFLQFLQRLGESKNAPTLVLVTHHVEEIMPVFSHVLILKNGSVLESGEKTDVLTSEALTKAFGARVNLKKKARRYFLKIQSVSKRMM